MIIDPADLKAGDTVKTIAQAPQTFTIEQVGEKSSFVIAVKVGGEWRQWPLDAPLLRLP